METVMWHPAFVCPNKQTWYRRVLLLSVSVKPALMAIYVYSHRMCTVIFSCSALLWLNSPRFSFRIATMVTGKRLADIGYRTFSASMMLLTVYGGYLCAMRGYRYMQRQKELKLAAENQHPEVLKDWPNGRLFCFSRTRGHFPRLHLLYFMRIFLLRM